MDTNTIFAETPILARLVFRRDEVCGSTGPRIGDEGVPRCGQLLDHEGLHCGYPESGFEDISWGDPVVRDSYFARVYSRAVLDYDRAVMVGLES